MEYVGFVLASLIFLHAAYNHLKTPSFLVGYAADAGFPVPQVAGRVSGVLLVAIGVLIALGTTVGFVAGAVFLSITGVYFHRNLADPATQKHWSLLGALLALAVVV